MYTQLMGGAPDMPCPDYTPAGGPDEPPKLLPGFTVDIDGEDGQRQ